MMAERLRKLPKAAPTAIPAPPLPRDKFLAATREEWESYFANGRVTEADIPALRRHIQAVDDYNRAPTPDERDKRGRAVRLSARSLGLNKPAEVVQETTEIPPGAYRRPDIDPRDAFAPTMMVPTHDGAPTLGPQIVAFIEHHLVFGPGDVHGQPARVEPDKAAIIWRAYELRPDGRRRFQRVAVSWRKGWSKTQCFCGWIGACELHPDAPVRFSHWAAENEPPSAWGWHYAPGEPVGVGVTDPVAFLMASTEEQAEQTGYAALRAILLESPAIRDDFDTGLDRVVRKNGTGHATAISTAPNPADGRLTTWVALDETGRLTKHERTHQAVLGNLSKRVDSWAMETSTAPAPNEGSIAERTREYADEIAAGEVDDPSLLYVHNQARQDRPLDTEDDARAALIEASGPYMAEWANIDGAVSLWADPNHDRGYFRRMQLNQPGVFTSDRVFDFEIPTCPRPKIERRQEIVLGFDGSLTEDCTVLGVHVLRTNEQMAWRMWERPQGAEPGWMVPRDEVDAELERLFHDCKVELLLCDPHYWRPAIAVWEGNYDRKVVRATGAKRVGAAPPRKFVDVFDTRSPKFIDALAAYRADLRTGRVKVANEPRLLQHFHNSRRDYKSGGLDADGDKRFTMRKETRALKIDGAVALTLAHVAARIVTAAGHTKSYGSRPGRSMVHA